MSMDQSGNLTKTSQILDENLYWQIIADSLKISESQDEQREYLVARLQDLTSIEIISNCIT